MSKKLLVLVVLVSALFIVVTAGCTGENKNQGDVPLPDDNSDGAPAFTTHDLFTKTEYNFPDDFAGKVVYMTFFMRG